MAEMAGMSFGKKLCEIFGLNPEEITDISINVGMDDVVTVTAVRIVYKDEGNNVIRHIEKYDFKANCRTIDKQICDE